MKHTDGQHPYINKVSNDTREYVQSLLDENERLHNVVESLQRERDLALDERRSYSERYVEVEQQNTNLANLYVAGYQLHGSLDRQEVLAAIKEIVINLIGSEDFAIFERHGENRLRMIDWFDEPPSMFHEVAFGEGIIGQVAATGQTFVSKREQGRSVGMAACVPLQVGGLVTGAIAIFRLLPQKHDGLEALDEELLGLLASQAGVALHFTALHAQVAAREQIVESFR
jgi:GAF domain-containing protein